MAQSGPRPSREANEAVAAASDAIATELLIALEAKIRAAGVALEAAGEVGSATIGASAVALVARDYLLERFDALGRQLTDEACDQALRVGGTVGATFRIVGNLAGRTDSGARYAFGRPREPKRS